MIILFKIILIFILFNIFYQDIKYREIHIYNLIILLFISFFLLIKSENQLYNSYYSFFFLIINLLGLWGYYILKDFRYIDYKMIPLGKGDIAFLFSIIPLFTTIHYILFYILGLVLSVIIFLIFDFKKNTIPLAGFMSVFLILIIIINWIFEKDIIL